MPPASHLLQPGSMSRFPQADPSPPDGRHHLRKAQSFPPSLVSTSIFLYSPFPGKGFFSVLFLKFPEFKMSTFD